MPSSQSLPVAEAIRAAYLERQDGKVEVERTGSPLVLFFRQGEIFLDRDHPAARHIRPLLENAGDRPAAVPGIQRALTTFSHDLVQDRKAMARWDDGPYAASDLVGPMPTVLVAMETATHGLSEEEIVERLGGEGQQYQSSDGSPALQQLPSLDPEMAQVLVGLVQPASVGEMLRGAGTGRQPLLRGLAKLRAIGLISEIGGRAQEDDESILSTKLLTHFRDRIGESLAAEPLELDTEDHRQRLAELLGNLGKLNHYELLDVGLKATDDEVLGAFNRLARVVHPNHATELRLEGREDTIDVLFERATEAYLVLSDPRRRSSYNMIVGIQLTTEVDADKRNEEKKRIAKQNYLRAGKCLSEMDYSLAIDLLKEAARLDPKPEYLARLGMVQNKNPKWRRHAIESYRRAVELAPNDAGVRLGYGEVLEAMERNSDAKVQYREALRLMPDNVAAQKALDRLR